MKNVIQTKTNNPIILILDLDGVLITTPTWKADTIDTDGYSAFNQSCVQNLNQLLTLYDFQIWLSSARRTVKTLQEFNLIFKNRHISQSIEGFVPQYPNWTNRKEEIIQFIKEYKIDNYLIIDDDKTLYDLNKNMKERLISTELTKGFTIEKLNEAIKKIP